MAPHEHVHRILILEDVESDAQLIEAELRRNGFRFESHRVWTMDAFLVAIDNGLPDAILADYTLPQFNAIDALQALRRRHVRVPFILVTGTHIEQIAVDCMREGADDYILKASLKRLPAALHNAITKRKAEQEKEAFEVALRASEERYRLITENSRDLVVLLNASGDVLYISPSSNALLGYTPEDLMAGAARCIIHPDDEEPAVAVFRRAMDAAANSTAEVRCKHRNGEWRTFECRGGWIVDDSGVGDRVVLVLRDVTQRRLAAEQLMAANTALAAREGDLLQALAALQESHQKLQATQMQLIESAKLESVGRLAAGVAHEVKNPLTVIVMGIEYLRHHVDAADRDMQEVLADMDEAIKRANGVIRGTLDFSAPHTLERKDVILNDSIVAATALLKHEFSARKITMKHQLATDLPALSLDPNKIEQVFVNVFLNAAEAIEGDGVVIVTTSVQTLGEIAGRVSGAEGGGSERVVVAEIEDTGRGIAAEHLGQIFDPFFTTKPPGQGTGLGMTVIKRIVELHGGMVRVENRDGGGARIAVMFPLWK